MTIHNDYADIRPALSVGQRVEIIDAPGWGKRTPGIVRNISRSGEMARVEIRLKLGNGRGIGFGTLSNWFQVSELAL